MKETTKTLLVLLFVVAFIATSLVILPKSVTAQQGLQDGRKLYNHSQDHLILPNGAPVYTASPGNGQGAITTDGASAYIYLNGVWCKVTVATPTPTPTPTFTPTPTP